MKSVGDATRLEHGQKGNWKGWQMMNNQEAIVYLEGQWDCMCSEDCKIYTGHKDCPQGFICNDGQALQMAISALQAQEAKTQLSAEGTTSDLISRKDAIEVIEEMQMPIMRSMFPEEQFVFKGMSEALSAIKDLPSAHPEIEERKEESAQNVPKEDLISRKEAIEAVKEAVISAEWKYAEEALEKLPSTDPEIIRCKDCKHHHYEKDIPYCDRIDYGYGWKDNDYCSRAERRTDEGD